MPASNCHELQKKKKAIKVLSLLRSACSTSKALIENIFKSLLITKVAAILNMPYLTWWYFVNVNPQKDLGSAVLDGLPLDGVGSYCTFWGWCDRTGHFKGTQNTTGDFVCVCGCVFSIIKHDWWTQKHKRQSLQSSWDQTFYWTSHK